MGREDCIANYSPRVCDASDIRISGASCQSGTLNVEVDSFAIFQNEVAP